jgi:hypothetical protein
VSDSPRTLLDNELDAAGGHRCRLLARAINSNTEMLDWSFVHVPKTGGASVSLALGLRLGRHHVRASICKGFTVAFVRNPFTRLESAFHFMRDPKWNQGAIPQEISFEEFVLSRGWERYSLFEPMTYYIDAPIGFIGRFEYLSDDFARLCSILGFKRPIALPEMHRRHARPEHWSQRMVTQVAAAYAEDFERFGYGTYHH